MNRFAVLVGLSRVLYLADVGQIAAIVDSRAVQRDSFGKLLRRLVLNIQEDYLRILHCESFHDRLADAGSAAGHYNDAIAEAWISSKSVSFFWGAIY